MAHSERRLFSGEGGREGGREGDGAEEGGGGRGGEDMYLNASSMHLVISG